MILRILRGRARSGELPRLVDAVQADVDEWAAIDGGIEFAQPAFRQLADGLDFLLVSTRAATDAKALTLQLLQGAVIEAR